MARDDASADLEQLKTWGAPAAVQAMAQLRAVSAPAGQAIARSGQRNDFLESFAFGAPPASEALKALDEALPLAFRSRQAPQDVKPERTVATVERTVEGITPWMQSPVSFSEALRIADNPCKWVKAASQMRTPGPPELLPANGALWRALLTKQTDFGKPLVSDLVSTETIHITAEGSTADDGLSGDRRYTYHLVATESGEGMMSLVRDEGWIELRGDKNGTRLRICKRATVLRPVVDPFGALLSIGFSTELWLWASGFFSAAQPARGPRPVAARPSAKQAPAGIKPGRQLAAGKKGPVKVVVLGGGPAGLACAWLLSNPTDPQTNKPAWSGPDDTFKMKVEVVEKALLPGGKAASGRNETSRFQYRIEEHGLHMLMGCYANLREILRWVGAEDRLDPIYTTAVPASQARTLDDLWRIDLKPWTDIQPASTPKGQPSTGPLRSDIAFEMMRTSDLSIPRDFGDPGDAPEHRPLSRAFIRLGQRLKDVDPPPAELNLGNFNALTTYWLNVRLIEALHDHSASPGEDKIDPVVALATSLRTFARRSLADAIEHAPHDAPRLLEWMELATTITIGLAKEDLFPDWAANDPKKMITNGYALWVSQMQDKLSHVSMEDWLRSHGAEETFLEKSRLLDAFTAAVFTTPREIAASTFIHGLARLLLTYEDAPYFRLKGGTGEAVIGPIFQSMGEKVTFRFGAEVKAIAVRNDRVTSVLVEQQATSALKFEERVSGSGKGWPVPPIDQPKGSKKEVDIKADVVVLAIPPFEQPLLKSHPPLAATLEAIPSCATLSLQAWGRDNPLLPGKAIVAGLEPPLRCAAVMDHLVETPKISQVPTYLCGELPESDVPKWQHDDVAQAWLDDHGFTLRDGDSGMFIRRVNSEKSDRYVLSPPDSILSRPGVTDSGLHNLWLAGDWTRTAFACGCIEGAITSGLEAARSILEAHGCVVNFDIVGAMTSPVPEIPTPVAAPGG